MPPRSIPLINGHIYHIYNKTIDNRKLFNDDSLASLMGKLLFFYRSQKSIMSYSRFKMFDEKIQAQIIKELLIKKYFKLDILSYCLMPNHFHLLVRQKIDHAISKYISDVLNALTRHYNIKYDRKGPLFLPRFKAKLITTREQLIHISRYIHLNPYSSGLITNIEELINYPWSSYPAFVHEKKDIICETATILSEFNNDKEKYQEFVQNNAEHQKMLQHTKYAIKWQK